MSYYTEIKLYSSYLCDTTRISCNTLTIPRTYDGSVCGCGTSSVIFEEVNVPAVLPALEEHSLNSTLMNSRSEWECIVTVTALTGSSLKYSV